MKQLFLVLLVLTVNLLLFQCGGEGPVVTTGGSEVWGKVVDTSGNGIPDVCVKLYPNIGEYLKDSTANVVTTDLNGEYHFEDPDAGSYVLSGTEVQSGRVFLHSEIEYDSGKIELQDTLKIPGELLIVFNGARNGILDGIAGYIPGTPYFNFVNNDSLLILRMAPGNYKCKAAVQTVGFLPVVTDTFLIQSGQRTVIDVELDVDTVGAPPAPENLSLVTIDTLNGRAVLNWDSVRVGDLKGYNLYRGTDLNGMILAKSDVYNTFDTIQLITDSTGKNIDNYFQVVSVDTRINESEFSQWVMVSAPSPVILKTTISDTLVIPHANLYIGDTAAIVVLLVNETRLIDSVIWSVDKPDSVIRQIPCGGVSQYIDTLKFVWNDSLAKTWYITTIDNSGASVTTVKRVTGSGMYPPNTWQIFPVRLPTVRQFLTVVSDGTNIYTLGGGRDNIAIDIIEYFAPDSSMPFQTMKMGARRYYHSSFLYNGKIYSIGGITTERKNVSTIEVYDPLTQQSTIVDSLPYIRYGASASVVGCNVYIAGGKIINDTLDEITGSIDVYDLNLLGNGSAALSHFGDLLEPRFNHSAVIYNNQIIVMGGGDTTGFYTLSSVESFDVQAGKNAQLPAMSDTRVHFSAALVDGKVFAFGGYVVGGGVLNSVEVLELDNAVSWTQVSTMDKAGFGMASVVHNGKIYLMGGKVVRDNGSTELDSTINVYYP